MLKIDFTNETVFSFDGPNLCLLGNEEDFLKLSKAIIDLTGIAGRTMELLSLYFVENVGEHKSVVFSNKKNANSLGVFQKDTGTLLFELDASYWDRLFRYFILMSWNKSTYYLNTYENCLDDLDLEQECNFICSSEF